MEPKLVTVCTYTSAVQAEMAKLALEAEGVTAFIGDATMVTAEWLIGSALGGVKLQVAEVDVPAAMAVLASHESLTNPSGDRPADDDVPRCLSCGATMPDEEEQYRAYRHVVEAFGGRPVVIRTFDVGGDKLPIGGYPTDANPFLGWRAIRMCLDEPELFKTQLRALLRAAMHGDVRIMFPLIITLDEVRQARGLLDEAAAELDARGVEYRHELPLGVMVETPAAALSIHTLVDDVSFFSIGTNDLVQYTLAVDRGSANLASRFTPLHPAVLTLIKRIVDVGVAHHLEVAVCGEMASQPLMAFALIGLGVRSLSVAGRAVPLVKRIVRGVSVAVAAEAANAALESKTAREAEGELRRRLLSAFGDAPFLRDGLPGFVDGNTFEGSGGLKASSAHE